MFAEPEGAPAEAAPALEFDLGPAALALARLIQPAAPGGSGADGSLKVRVGQENCDLKLTVPKQAVELPRSFRPLLEALAKLGG